MRRLNVGGVVVIAPRLPGGQAELGEYVRVGGGLVGFGSRPTDGGVLAVSAAAGFRREAGDDNVGTKLPDGAHHIPQQALPAPFCERFFGRLAETEIDRAGEELLAAVDAAGFQQLLRADHAQQRALLGADQVLSAFAARRGKVAGAGCGGRARNRQ